MQLRFAPARAASAEAEQHRQKVRTSHTRARPVGLSPQARFSSVHEELEWKGAAHTRLRSSAAHSAQLPSHNGASTSEHEQVTRSYVSGRD